MGIGGHENTDKQHQPNPVIRQKGGKISSACFFYHASILINKKTQGNETSHKIKKIKLLIQPQHNPTEPNKNLSDPYHQSRITS
jgi:hypothetical protein